MQKLTWDETFIKKEIDVLEELPKPKAIVQGEL